MGNLAYMCRLGLWGPGSAFKDFEVGVIAVDRTILLVSPEFF